MKVMMKWKKRKKRKNNFPLTTQNHLKNSNKQSPSNFNERSIHEIKQELIFSEKFENYKKQKTIFMKINFFYFWSNEIHLMVLVENKKTLIVIPNQHGLRWE
jgi:hypothetical protein